MADISHASLTGSELHEPKGVASAPANYVYASNGAGSGTWVDMNTLVTSTNFTTGDGKLTLKTIADSGWVMMNDGTIGDAVSGATTRANADTQNLYNLIYANIPDAWAPVTGGRGANAAADWAAHKPIALTKQLGRAILLAGAGSGLTSRVLGSTGGAETHALILAELAAHAHTGTTGTESAFHTHTGTFAAHSHATTDTSITVPGNNTAAAAGAGVTVANAVAIDLATANTGATGGAISVNFNNTTHTHPFTTANAGSGTAHNNMQPWSAWNIMIKL